MQEVIHKLKLFVNRYTGPKTHNQSGQLKLSNKKADLSFAVAGVFMFSFLLSFIAGSFIIQPQDGQAVTGLGLVGAPAMTFHTSSGSVNMEITPSASGTLASASHTLTASTNVPTGYSLSLTTTTTPSLATSTGTISAPTVLSNNTWGFALNRVSSSTAANTVTNGFDTSYVVPTPSATSKWANPSANATIKNTRQATSSDTTTIYYGAKADMTLKAGTYSNSVRYTATPNLVSIPESSILSVTPGSGTTAGGTAIQIVGTGFAVNDQSVTTAVTIGGMNCEDVSISSNTPATGQDTVYCTTPAASAGAKDVKVTTWGGTATKAGGYIYSPATVSFVSPSVASTAAGTESGPAFTIVGTGFTGVSNVTIGGIACASFTVVSNTQIFCKAPNTINTTGNKAVVVTKSGIDSNNTVAVSYNSTNYPTFQAGNAYSQCSTTAKIFRDTRDSQLYYVKKMPDNKCWMVDNLKYANYGELITSGALTIDGKPTYDSTGKNYDAAKFVDPGGNSYCYGNLNMPSNTSTRCGLTYNWYTATNGTGTSAITSGYAAGSICPANWRLPGGGTDISRNDFASLNGYMAGDNAPSVANDATHRENWNYDGAFSPVYSGGYSSTYSYMGNSWYYWTSGSRNASSGYLAYINGSQLYPGDAGTYPKNQGFAVRCVMDEPAQNGDTIQDVTIATCPTERTWVVDARDKRTYWIQKMADGKCWMLTNLAYAGGGTNTYGDTKTLIAGTTYDYAPAQYYVPTGSNVTSGTTNPSTSTDGTGQYAYLYNWCAAMGNQSSTSACANATTPAPNTSISICPAGWRLPTGGSGGEFQALNTAVNSGSTSSDSGLRSAWLAMYSGEWSNGFSYQGSRGSYWSSTQASDTIGYGLGLNSSSSTVYTAYINKRDGKAVRCIAL